VEIERTFLKNVSLSSHDKLLLVCRGLSNTYEKPTMNSNYEFIVATPVIFNRDSELEKMMGHFHENAVLGGGSRG